MLCGWHSFYLYLNFMIRKQAKVDGSLSQRSLAAPISKYPNSAHSSGPSQRHFPCKVFPSSCHAHPPAPALAPARAGSMHLRLLQQPLCNTHRLKHRIANVCMHVAPPYTRVSFLGQSHDCDQFMSTSSADVAWLVAVGTIYQLNA